MGGPAESAGGINAETVPGVELLPGRKTAEEWGDFRGRRGAANGWDYEISPPFVMQNPEVYPRRSRALGMVNGTEVIRNNLSRIIFFSPRSPRRRHNGRGYGSSMVRHLQIPRRRGRSCRGAG